VEERVRSKELHWTISTREQKNGTIPFKYIEQKYHWWRVGQEIKELRKDVLGGSDWGVGRDSKWPTWINRSAEGDLGGRGDWRKESERGRQGGMGVRNKGGGRRKGVDEEGGRCGERRGGEDGGRGAGGVRKVWGGGCTEVAVEG